MKKILISDLRGLALVTATFMTLTIGADAQDWASYTGKQLSAYQLSGDTERSIASIASARDTFLKSLNRDQQAKTLMPALDGEWRKWSNLPPRPDYAGVLIKDLSPDQIHAFLDLMAASTSASGFIKMRDIILSDDKLVNPNSPRNSTMLMGSDYYFICLFGKPSDSEVWGWQLDGHHLGLNVIIQEGQLSIAPSFIGTQPANFNYGSRKGIQPMMVEGSLPYKIAASLTDDQRQKLVVGPRTQGLEAGPGADQAVVQAKGLPIKEMNADQKKMVLQLAGAWISILPEPWASHESNALEKSLNEAHIAWKGETGAGSPMYYQILAPGFFAEFCHQNLGGDPMNHLHSVYRKPGQDYLGAAIGQ